MMIDANRDFQGHSTIAALGDIIKVLLTKLNDFLVQAFIIAEFVFKRTN